MKQFKRKVITLCGSTKFKEQFEEVNAQLTMAGYVVISVGVFGHADKVEFTDGQKEQLDKVHLQKIDMADEIFVINVGGYIGSSTFKEIFYAKSQFKPVFYLEERAGGKAKSSNFFVVEDKKTEQKFLYEKQFGQLPAMIGELENE